MYDHEKVLLGILVTLLSLIGVLVWLGVLAEDAKIDGCRDAGGAGAEEAQGEIIARLRAELGKEPEITESE